MLWPWCGITETTPAPETSVCKWHHKHKIISIKVHVFDITRLKKQRLPCRPCHETANIFLIVSQLMSVDSWKYNYVHSHDLYANFLRILCIYIVIHICISTPENDTRQWINWYRMINAHDFPAPLHRYGKLCYCTDCQDFVRLVSLLKIPVMSWHQ